MVHMRHMRQDMQHHIVQDIGLHGDGNVIGEVVDGGVVTEEVAIMVAIMVIIMVIITAITAVIIAAAITAAVIITAIMVVIIIRTRQFRHHGEICIMTEDIVAVR